MREAARASLTAKLLEGQDSGEPIPLTAEYFKEKDRRLTERMSGKKRK
jgi:hypothetical protein